MHSKIFQWNLLFRFCLIYSYASSAGLGSFLLVLVFMIVSWVYFVLQFLWCFLHTVCIGIISVFELSHGELSQFQDSIMLWYDQVKFVVEICTSDWLDSQYFPLFSTRLQSIQTLGPQKQGASLAPILLVSLTGLLNLLLWMATIGSHGEKANAALDYQHSVAQILCYASMVQGRGLSCSQCLS